MSKDYFTWLGIRPIDDQMNHLRQFLPNLISFLVLLILGLAIVLSAITSFNYGTADLINALFVAVPGVSAFKVLASFISIIVYRQKITLFFEKLQIFYNQNKLASIKTD